MAAKNSTNQGMLTERDFKQHVLSCLTKLSDRDTYSSAATELESIAKNLKHDNIPPFVASITATDSSDKSLVRKQCVKLISIISECHGNLISPHLSKILSSIIRRLCDPNSAVRSACITAISSISSHITKPPFSLIAKPIVDALVTAQEMNFQSGAALCLAAAIDGSPDPEPVFLKRVMQRLEKLLRSECFKAKAALLSVFVSVIGVNGALSQQGVRNLVICLVEFVSSEDWGARKAAAEALGKLALVEKNLMIEYKVSCLKTFEAKRFDKVKVVRESMNEMVKAWKELPDELNDVSPAPKSQSASNELASEGQNLPSSKKSSTGSSVAPQGKQNHSLVSDAPQTNDSSLVTAGKTSLNKTAPAMFRKLDRMMPANQKSNIATPVSAVSVGSNWNEKVFDNSDEKKNRIDVSRARNEKEVENLSVIQKQLLQIENQQSILLNILQGFIGTSRNGMHALESRVHGLELALDEISYELAVPTGRMSNTNSSMKMCCKLPGTGFISSKFGRTNSPLLAVHNMSDENCRSSTHRLKDRRFQLQGDCGFILNPLAEVQDYSHRS
ncbi:microtubule-associated protein TORTIFOLIA1-like [Heracleum sosnowskyi]|uniref:Microtubule-associated protein TORTIFOLIA1-like n=1 Tax=Heracleum sosnowskyi TaxID=360622 RepID=A0AAD8H905_9APIA|nr:microtubule-associated protein TORTIFOLIA1-like [Heracleum sosnowskyi]